MSRGKRRRSLASWIRHLGYHIEWWHVGPWGNAKQAMLSISCYRPDMSTHLFFF